MSPPVTAAVTGGDIEGGRRRVAAFPLYLVTDRHQTGGRPLIEVVEQALGAGVGAVQLRERDLDTRTLLALARELRALTRRYGAALLINDRIDVALACDADGVHLPAQSFTVRDARALLGSRRIIGVSTHHPGEVTLAADAGADFAVFGPVFETPSKHGYGPPLGLDALAAATAHSRIPVLAIGGVIADRVSALIARGATGVAVIRAVLAADDPGQAASQLTAAVRMNPSSGSKEKKD
jgi:thiamine-phosphate pyrophosphorylase